MRLPGMKFRNILLILCLSVLIAGCAKSPYAKTDKVYKKMVRGFAKTMQTTSPDLPKVDSLSPALQSWVGTVNMGIRKPNYVIIHHTAQDSTAQTLHTFTITRTQVSAHYVIGRDGKVVQMVNDYLRAQHAGVGKWGNDTDLNSVSIGIELDNNGNEPFSDAQISSLLAVLGTLKKKYAIPTANFIGHADIAPTRKPDPSNFPWKTLAQKGYGFWYDDSLQTPPLGFDHISALRIIGYDVRNADAALIAFKRHFVQTDISPTLTEYDRTLIYNLYRKYMY